MTRAITLAAYALAGTLALGVPARAGADDSIETARDLYAGAAYEDALALLERLRPADARDQRAIAQYRAFCFLALGRSAEADHAIAGLVAADPFYQPPDTEASPRLRAAFGEVRRRLLPAIIQERYGHAKSAFDRKELPAARDAFLQVLLLLSDRDLGAAANQPPLADLRTLAIGFGDLSAAIPSTPLPQATPAPVAAAAAPNPPPARPRVYGADDANVVPPAIIRQELPPLPFKPASDARGAIAVLIDESGVVEAVAMLEPFRTPYDRVLVEAASRWRYRPASLDGAAVKFRKVIAVNVSSGQ